MNLAFYKLWEVYYADTSVMVAANTLDGALAVARQIISNEQRGRSAPDEISGVKLRGEVFREKPPIEGGK